MRKIISKIAGLLLGLSLAAGVGLTLGTNSKQETKATSTGAISVSSVPECSTTNGTQVGSLTLSSSPSITLSVNTDGNNGKFYGSGTEWRLYQTNNPQVVLTIDSSYVLDSVSFNYTYSSTGVLTYNSTQYPSNESITLGGTSNTATFGVGNTGSATNGQVKVKSVTVEYSSAGGGTDKTVTGLTVTGSMTKTTYTTAESWDPSGLVVTATYDNDSSDTEVVTSKVSSWSYSPAKPTASTTEVVATATYKGVSGNSSAQSVTVTAVPGTADLPYTVTEARAFIDTLGSGTAPGKYVSGIISQVDSFNSTYNSITYWISDNGTTTNQLQCYSGKGLNNTNFSKVDDVEVGATVVVTGTLKKHNSTYEFDYNNYLVSYTVPTPPTVFTVSYDANGGSGTLEDNTEYASGDSVQVLANTFTAPSNLVEFKEFNTKRDGTGDSYSAGDHFNIDSIVTLYAIWQVKAATLDDGTYTSVLSYTNPISNLVDVKISDTAYTCLSVTSSGLTYDDNNNSFKLSKDGSIEFVNNSNAKIVKAVVNVYKYNNFDLYEDGSSTATYNGEGSQIDTGNIDVEITTNASSSIKVVCNGGSGSYNQSLASITLTLEVSTPKVLSSISVSGAESSFDVGDAFTYNDLVVTAHYDNGSSATVTPTSVSSPDMSTVGSKTVTVSYTEGEVTETAQYTIQVNAVTKYTVSFASGGGSGSMSSVQVKEGTDYELPECSFNPPEGKVFDHWEVDGVEKTVIENIDDDYIATATWKDAPNEKTITWGISEGKDVTTDGYAFVKNSGEFKNNLFYQDGSPGLEIVVKSDDDSAWWGSNIPTSRSLTVTVGGGTAKDPLVNSVLAYFIDSTGAKIDASEKVVTTAVTTAAGSEFTIEMSATENVYGVMIKHAKETSYNVRLYGLSFVYSFGGSAQTYTITYDSNGGSGSMGQTSGANPQVAACSFTAPSGKEFSRWNDAADGTGDNYAVGSYVSADVTLYAIWAKPAVDPSAYFTKITDDSEITDGKYLIVYEAGNLCFDGSLTSLDAASNTKELTLANLLTSYFTISNGEIRSASGKYIGNNSDSNALTTSSTALENTVSIDENGNLVVVSSGGAYLRYNKTSGQERFRYFKSSTYTSQESIALYKVNIAKVLLGEVTCDDTGATMPDGSWSDIESYYNTLSTSEKNNLKTAEASESGSELAQALAKYDYIVGKYLKGQGLSTYKDFMQRDPATIAGSRYAFQANEASQSSTIIIVLVALTSITSIGVLLVIKRKRSLVK